MVHSPFGPPGGGGTGTVDLTSGVTGILPSANGGTGSAYTEFTGPAASKKTFTLPNASATILTSNAVVTTAQGGTGSAYFAIAGPTTARVYTFPDAAATIASASATLTANALLVGGGAAIATPLGSLGTTTTVLHGNAAGAPTFGAVSLTADVSGTLPVANGGTGLTAGTSGGILAFTASGTLASSAALTAKSPVIGGGAGVVPATATAPTTTNAVADVIFMSSATTQTALELQTPASFTGIPVFATSLSSGVQQFAINHGAATFSGTKCMFVGPLCGTAATTASGVTAFGYNAVHALTTGTGAAANIVAIGTDAMKGATTAANDCTAVGFSTLSSATLSGNANTAVGANAGAGVTSGASNTHIGRYAGNGTSTASSQCFIGYNCGYGNNIGSSTWIGVNHTGPTATGTIVIGAGGSTVGISGSTNEFIVQGPTNWYGATGAISTSAAAYTINGCGGSGTDNAGAAVKMAGGKSTGTAAGGNTGFQTAFSAATGSTANTLVDRHVIVAQGKALTDASAVSLFEVALPTLQMCGGKIVATIRCTDGTDMQSFTQEIQFAAVNKGGSYTTAITVDPTDLISAVGTKAVSAGTLTSAWTILTGTNKITIQLNADTSLTPSGTNGFVVYYEVFNHSQQAITVL